VHVALPKCPINQFRLLRGWCIKFETGLKCLNRHRSKSIKVIRLSLCQNDSPMGGSFWQKDSLISFILFELCLLKHFSPVSNLMHHPLVQQRRQQVLIVYCPNIYTGSISELKPKAIIAGITENPATQFVFIHFFIDNSNANISLYTLSCPKLKSRYYLTFEIII
jgi:hypothetical protein